MTLTHTRHWGTNTRQFLRQHLERFPTDHLRIATGYFTIGGQDALRDGFDTTAWILVGYEETARETETENITRLIQEELETTPTLTYEAIRRLADDLEERVRVVQTRYRRGDHAKVFILGRREVFIGSANLTDHGMRRNAESLQREDIPDRVAGWIADFDRRWNDERTRDVTGELRSLLLAWLRFALPFDAYLAACYTLLDNRAPVTPREDYREPLPFQRVVARRAAASIARYEERGHWIIASTGLGKTIMATHVALLLHQRQIVRDVIVIAPTRTLDEWERRMRSAGVSAEVFSTAVLRRDPKAKSQVQSRKLQREFDHANEETLLVIDESHELRNRYDDRGGVIVERTFVDRIGRLVETKRVRVLLLTATPYAKSLEGINNQLLLLPRTGSPEGTLGLDDNYPHRIERIEQIYGIPVVTAISYNTVRHQFASHDEHGTFVTYPDGAKGYVQTLATRKIPYTPLAAEAVLEHLELFSHVVQHRTDPETRQRTLDGSSVKRQLVEALTSSPADLKRFLTQELKTPSKVDFHASKASRDKAIHAILPLLEGDVAAQDEKLQHLLALLQEARGNDEKVLIFVLRKSTGRYLKEQLRKAGHRTEFLYGGSQNADAIIQGFAPHANPDTARHGPPGDVLIATDTIAAGVNLQDATVVVHYDAPWGADIFNQRNGRITRFRPHPTTITTVLFTARENLKKHSTLDARLANADVFNSVDRLEADVPDGEIEGEVLRASSEHRSSDVLSDFATLARHETYAASLRLGQITARYGPVEHITTTTILRIRGAADAIAIRKVHHERGHAAHRVSDSEALQAFRCRPSEMIAAVPFPTIDRLAKRAIQEYLTAREREDQQVHHVATVALIPPSHPRGLVEAPAPASPPTKGTG